MFDGPIPQSLQNYLGKPDERVSGWILLNSPVCLFAIFLTYVGGVFGCKTLMEKRKALKLYRVLVVYNAFQVLYSAYIFMEVLMSALLGNYKLSCSPLDRTWSPVAMRMARAFWMFYLSKIIDLFDTLFFVLRKKKSQLTFLHCYHHASMIFNWYLGVLYLPGGQAFLSVLFNSAVHVIMYAYYFLSAMGPKFKIYLWWKKYLTQLQLVQFFCVMFHIIVGLRNDCDAPKWLAYFTITYLSTLVLLFLNFYTKTYKTQKLKRRHGSGPYDLKAAGDWKTK